MVRIRRGEEEEHLTWEEWEKRVREGRITGDSLVCADALSAGNFVRADAFEIFHSLRQEAETARTHALAAGGVPIVTALLVGVQVRIWWFAHVPAIRESAVRRFTNWTAPALDDGETWRMLTMGVLHTEFFHVVLNMLWLAATGWNIERSLGRANLVTIYFASVVGGSLLSMFGSPATPSLGASGGIFGLVAASVVIGAVRPDILPARGRSLFGWAMLPYLLIMLYAGFQNDGTDNLSHLGGALIGSVLAVLLDAPASGRQIRRNRFVQLGAASSAVAVLISLATLGPRLHPLRDQRKALAQAERFVPELDGTLAPPYRTLDWVYPAGWRREASVAEVGFRSPTALRRWRVRERHLPRPVDPLDLISAFSDQLLDEDPEGVVESHGFAQVAGWDGVAIRARTRASVVEWRVAVRGRWILEERWEVDPGRYERLIPLRDRLRRQVVWRDPIQLADARQLVQRNPGSVRGRVKLARGLLDVGEAVEAVEIWKDLLAERPEDLTVWTGILETQRLYPAAVKDAEANLTAALRAHPVPEMVVEAASALDAMGRTDDTAGLLDLGWMRWPGDRRIRSARRARQMPIALEADTSLPWFVLRDVETGEPREQADLAARLSTPLSLAAAHAWGTESAAARDRLADQAQQALAEGRDADAAMPLLRLKYGPTPEIPEGALVGLVEDLETVRRGTDVLWVPKRLADALRSE